MNILYFNPSSRPGARRRMITGRCHDIVSTGIQADALRLMHNRSFDAVVIENEDEDSELLDFTLKLYGFRPRLPVFLTNDWRTDLPMGLKGLATGAFAW
jgi:hypothetical protein